MTKLNKKRVKWLVDQIIKHVKTCQKVQGYDKNI